MDNTIDEYLLDTNVLIQAFNECYAFDLVPTFWSMLANEPAICSIDKVRNEISDTNTRLSEWADRTFKRWEHTGDEDTTRKYREIIEWSNSNEQFTEGAKEAFADESKADAWLIAHALVTKRIVVTEEKFSREAKRTIPIPNVCEQFKIQHTNTYNMLRNLEMCLAPEPLT